MGWTAATKFRAPIDIQLCFPKGSMGGLYICSMGDFYGKCIGNIPYMNSMGLYILRIFILSNSIYVIMSIIVRSFFYFYLFYHLYGPISSFSPSNIYIYIVMFMSTSMSIYLDVSENSGTPKSSILVGLSMINHPFWGTTIFGNTDFCPAFYCQFPKLTMQKNHLLTCSISSCPQSPRDLHEVRFPREAFAMQQIFGWKWLFVREKKRSLMEIHLFFQYISTSSEILQKLQPVMCVFTAFVWILFGNIVGNLSFRGLESLRVNFINISLSSMQIYMNHVYVPAPAKECQGVNSPCS